MDILGLTNFAQIRGVLTVSPADLPDGALAGYALEDDLGASLDAWFPNWSSATDASHLRLLRLYAKYFCAGTVARTAAVFVLTKRSDGSNEGQRSGDGYEELANQLLGQALVYRLQLESAVGGQSASGRFSLTRAVRPARDPVVEPRAGAEES